MMSLIEGVMNWKQTARSPLIIVLCPDKVKSMSLGSDCCGVQDPSQGPSLGHRPLCLLACCILILQHSLQLCLRCQAPGPTCRYAHEISICVTLLSCGCRS